MKRAERSALLKAEFQTRSSDQAGTGLSLRYASNKDPRI